MGPANNFVHFKHACWFLFIQSCSIYHQMNAGKRFIRNPNSTKRLKIDRVVPVDKEPPMTRMGPKTVLRIHVTDENANISVASKSNKYLQNECDRL